MLPMTRWFGVTFSDDERSLEAETACVDEIVERVLQMQAQAAARQRRPLARGTHAKGVVAKAKFEVFDVAESHEPALAARLAKGIFAKPGLYPATVRFANADANVNSDFKADVRALSFSVDLTHASDARELELQRQDFSLQNATVLPLNDAPAFLATMKFITAPNPAKGFVALSRRDKLRVVRALALDQIQARQEVKPYQQLRYWSNVPYRHGATDFVKQSASPSPSNPARPLRRDNSDALRDELARHIDEDALMSSFDFGLQLLDIERMTYWGERRDASFWIENASVEWKESRAPFFTVGRLTLEPKSGASDGFDMVPHLTGEMAKSPRNVIMYFSDDGDVLAVRVGDYKFHLAQQRAQTVKLWSEPFVKLRLPYIMNLRLDPFEAAEFNSGTYSDWMVDQIPQLYLMQAVVAGQIAEFAKFPPRQKPASFNLDAVLAQVSNHGGHA
jgi:hypothetical protein